MFGHEADVMQKGAVPSSMVQPAAPPPPPPPPPVCTHTQAFLLIIFFSEWSDSSVISRQFSNCIFFHATFLTFFLSAWVGGRGT